MNFISSSQREAVPAGREREAHSGERRAHPDGAATGGFVHQGMQDGRKRESCFVFISFLLPVILFHFVYAEVVVMVFGGGGR